MSEETIERRLAELREYADLYATALAEREYLEDFKKSKLALLMKEAEASGYSTAVAQEREARADPEYIALLRGLQVATKDAEALRWKLKISEIGAEVWRTQQANSRAERKGYGA